MTSFVRDLNKTLAEERERGLNAEASNSDSCDETPKKEGEYSEIVEELPERSTEQQSLASSDSITDVKNTFELQRMLLDN